MKFIEILSKSDPVGIIATVLLFIVPGFIIYSILLRFNRKIDIVNQVYLRSIVYSCINALIYLVILGNLPKFDIKNSLQFEIFFGFFILPIIIAIIGAYCIEKEVVSKLFKFIRLNPIHKIDTGWDFKFRNTSAMWVIIILKDNTIIRGLYNKKSLAASNTNSRDIYLEKQCNNEWVVSPTDAGVLVKYEEIKYIEFRDIKEK